MEIERKYLLDQLPENLTSYPCKKIEQGYLSTEPVVRIRKQDDTYYENFIGGVIDKSATNII